ncbi:hypothetical protein BDA96_05G074900 [Sorghum bicolor]|uniref:Uncharacterized protein n=2 Tax=Sorghum bicolor TaxID=4558 RepID=A0A921UG08_SORBI|nr:hypothetical protein BDA96_05G074900 [Sorghum bicolor]KXG28000.1 hypothetical protein SORBI_3005G074300 [Sorghum bicolor]
MARRLEVHQTSVHHAGHRAVGPGRRRRRRQQLDPHFPVQTLPVLNDDEQPGIDAHFLMNDRPPLISPHLRRLELSGIIVRVY